MLARSSTSLAATARPWLGLARPAARLLQIDVHSQRSPSRKGSEGRSNSHTKAVGTTRSPRQDLPPPPQRQTWRDRMPKVARETMLQARAAADAKKAASAASAAAKREAERSDIKKLANYKANRFSDAYLLAEHVKRRIRQNRIDEALLDIRASPRANAEAPVWNLVLLHLARQGMYRKSMDLFNEMKKRGARPDERTWAHLFESLANSASPPAKKATDARALLTRIAPEAATTSDSGFIQRGKSLLNPVVFNGYLKALARSGQVDLLVESITANQHENAFDQATFTIALNTVARTRTPNFEANAAAVVDHTLAYIHGAAKPAFDAELLCALCAVAQKSADAQLAALPLHLVQRTNEALSGRSMFPADAELPEPRAKWNLCQRYAHQGVFPIPSRVANWLLMAASRVDKDRYADAVKLRTDAKNAASGLVVNLHHGDVTATPAADAPSAETTSSTSTTSPAAALHTEHLFSWLQSRNADLDALAHEVLFASMAQCGRSEALLAAYFAAHHPTAAAALKFDGTVSVVTLGKNAADPTRAAFASLLFAARDAIDALQPAARRNLGTEERRARESPVATLLEHYASVVQDDVVGDTTRTETRALISLGRALTSPGGPPRPRAATARVLEILLAQLGVRPGSVDGSFGGEPDREAVAAMAKHLARSAREDGDEKRAAEWSSVATQVRGRRE
ncbi:hypothetical protein H9P43_000117 [Blastocladiella emersonii ATCC 22665]|nr:hypothetical protein H9P43_000117 [Blastocladiella emersonii ATCC 22665]